MKKIFFTITIYALFLSGCKTVDLEYKTEAVRDIQSKETIKTENLEAEKRLQIEQISATVDMEKQIIYIEKPVILPPLEQAPKKIEGKQAIENAMKNFVEPEWVNGSALVIPYNEDEVYRVYTQVLQMTNIYLEPGEVMIGEPAISDKPRFILGAGLSMKNGIERQHIYVKPTEAGLVASLIINTNKRVYNLVLYTYTNLYAPIVRWTYHDTELPKIFAGMKRENVTLDGSIESIDPRFLSTDYRMSFNVFSKPDWTPKSVYDDGKKTYILMPEIVLQRELPGCFENKGELLNYRVLGNLFVIDKLIQKISFKYKNQEVKIWKK